MRRPLPTPNPAPVQRPNTPVTPNRLNSAIPPTSFYGSAVTPSAASHSDSIGSRHTTYISSEDPPAYGSPGFREPELVAEDGPMPEPSSSSLQWQDGDTSWNLDENSWVNSDWDGYSANVANTRTWDVSSVDPNVFTNSFMSIPKSLVEISGRDEFEEQNWWDPHLAARQERPGPGMLPTMLADWLHDPDHSLFSVSVIPPNLQPHSKLPGSSVSTESSPDVSIDSPSSPLTVPHTPHQPPTEDDVRMAVPHPNAYFCPKENGWVILIWKFSSAPFPISQSFDPSDPYPLPFYHRRKFTHNCLNDEGPNKTHHFHRYPHAVDSHKLTPPFRLEEWETVDCVKQKRRGATASFDIDITQIDPNEIDTLCEEEKEAEGKLFDLYVCCQCSFYCVASGVLPGVIPRKCFDEFVRDKKVNPPVGRTGDHSVVLAFETFILVIENTLWKGERRLLRVTRRNFQDKLRWNANTKKIFGILGFTEQQLDGEPALNSPMVDVCTPEGRMTRRKLLRCWAEASTWLADFKRVHATRLKDSLQKRQLWVQIASAREDYQTAVGAHPDQIPRGELDGNALKTMQHRLDDWRNLGLTPTSYSAELLVFSYYAQCRCDPRSSHKYFSNFVNIVDALQGVAECPSLLQEVVVIERSRDRFTIDEVERAATILGFGVQGPLKVEYDEADVDEEFIENAWRDCVKQSWRDLERGSESLRNANEALRILAEARGSGALRKVWEGGKDRIMNPERAYDTLEVPKETDDLMLITVFNMRMEESPVQQQKMRDALQIIAEVRDSERLRQFLELGRDPGDIISPVRLDMPRGLNQLGNTCYLNSLLQYFYTIKDLREAVMPMSKLDVKSLDYEKLSDDDLKRHRVGGRLVTRKEIWRSKKFINQLADLFYNLEFCEATAVTPTVELAKLALVTSRDEEEEEADKVGTDSSNDTDATLVDDGAVRVNISETELSRSARQSPDSVLGKRPRDMEKQPNSMELDGPPGSLSPNSDVPALSPMQLSSDSPPPLEVISPSYNAPAEASSLGNSLQVDNDIEMRATPAPRKGPPALPPRKSTTSDSFMMFGKQHDVAECMDNCMFQIETALLKFDGFDVPSEIHETSVVKRLFYGKLRQRLTGHSPSNVNEKKDLFSHLPVNVTDDGVDIYDGLSRYFDDIVDFESEKRRMEVTLVDLPPLLQIQLQRVQFNRETLQPYKSQAYVKFWETIYMDRFMDNADLDKRNRSKAIQSELNSCRDRLRLLQGKDGSYLSSLAQTKDFLSKLDWMSYNFSDELLMHLGTEQQILRTEIDEMHIRIRQLKDELESVWQDSKEMAYELTSVFVHRGSSPSWGHYFFYSRHLPDHPNSWFKYNDSDVTVVSNDEVLADTTGSTANPYLLVFARKGTEVVDTVKRFDPSILN